MAEDAGALADGPGGCDDGSDCDHDHGHDDHHDHGHSHGHSHTHGGAPCTGHGHGDPEGDRKIDEDLGKEEYKKGNYAEAVKAWSRSLMSVKYILDKGLYKHNEEQMQEVYAMETRICLNMSQGYLKTGEWGNAVTYADRALARDPANTKALYRKASAYMQTMDFEEAMATLQRLLEAEPGNAAATALLAEARRSKQVSDRKAKEMSKRIFGGAAKEREGTAEE